MDNKLEFTTIDEYITQAPPETKEVLQKIRETIKVAAPEATEKISYQMPTFLFGRKPGTLCCCEKSLRVLSSL